MSVRNKLFWPFLAGVLSTLCCGLCCGSFVWLAAHANAPVMTVHAKAQDTYQLPTRGAVCAIGIFQGVYVFTVEGVIVNTDVKQNYAGLGILALDGQGNALLRINQSYEGRISGVTTIAGSADERDCRDGRGTPLTVRGA